MVGFNYSGTFPGFRRLRSLPQAWKIKYFNYNTFYFLMQKQYLNYPIVIRFNFGYQPQEKMIISIGKMYKTTFLWSKMKKERTVSMGRCAP